MQQKPVLDEARQLKRLNAATRRQSHMYKWIALIAALDALVCGYLWIRDRNKARGYRREFDRKFGKRSGD